MSQFFMKNVKLVMILGCVAGLLLLINLLNPSARVARMSLYLTNEIKPAAFAQSRNLAQPLPQLQSLEPVAKMELSQGQVAQVVSVKPSKSGSGPNDQFFESAKSLTMTEIKNTTHNGILLTSTNWEELTKNDPPLTDWTSVADPKSSVFFIKDMKPSYRIGDEIILNITVKDYNGRRKSKGGDVVRFLLKDTTNNARSTGYVIDHQDGSYTGVAKVLWAGDVTIEASVGSSRELIKIMYRNMKTGNIKKPFLGTFTRGSDAVTVKCTPVKKVASLYKESCNLTHMNADLPWFCEKRQHFPCEKGNYHYITRDIHVTAQEKIMLDRSKDHKLSGTIRISVVKDNDTVLHFLQKRNQEVFKYSCNILSTKHTWTAQSSVGYLFQGTWYSTQCRSTFGGSVESFQTCLHDRKVWFLGDSNMREMFSYYMNLLKLTLVTEQWKGEKWHKPSQASNQDRTISVFFGFHAMPAYGGGGIHATHEYIDHIPPNSKDIVIVHFYMHFQPFHPSVVREHIRKTAKSIKALKARAPEVKVIVRGSHALLLLHELTHFDDVWGIVYNQILKEEFASMVNNVIYLDMWDLTVSTENWDIHPPRGVLEQGVRYMMSLICP